MVIRRQLFGLGEKGLTTTATYCSHYKILAMTTTAKLRPVVIIPASSALVLKSNKTGMDYSISPR